MIASVIKNRLNLKTGISLFFVSGYLSIIKSWGDCNYFSYQIELLPWVISLVLLFIVSFVSSHFLFIFLEKVNAHLYQLPVFLVLSVLLLLVLIYTAGFSIGDLRNILSPTNLGILIGLILSTLSLFFFKKKVSLLGQLLKIIGYIGFLISILFTIRIVTNYDCFFSHVKKNEFLSSVKDDKQVIWIIFDEFDPEIAFTEVPSEQLKNFNTIKNSGIFNRRFFSAANHTLSSIPASLSGKGVKEVKKIDHNGQLWLMDQHGREFQFSEFNSVFKKLTSDGFTASIFGFYHPYCKIFKNIDCQQYSNNIFSWHSGITQPISRAVVGIFPTQSIIPMSWTGDILTMQLNDLNGFISKKNHNLLFVHLMVPHLPGKYSQYYFSVKANNSKDEYLINIRLADKILGDVLSSIPADGRKRLLILESDHWWRGRGMKSQFPSLSIAKIIHDDRGMVNHEPTSAIYTSNLAIEFLNGHLNTNEDILKFYSNKKYHETYMPVKVME